MLTAFATLILPGSLHMYEAELMPVHFHPLKPPVAVAPQPVNPRRMNRVDAAGAAFSHYGHVQPSCRVPHSRSSHVRFGRIVGSTGVAVLDTGRGTIAALNQTAADAAHHRKRREAEAKLPHRNPQEVESASDKAVRLAGNRGTDLCGADGICQAMVIEDADREYEREVLSNIARRHRASARLVFVSHGTGERTDPLVRLAKDVPELRPYIRESQELLENAFVQGTRILLEGTKGTSLSLHHGPYPFVASRDTTVAGCLADAGIAVTRVRRVLMVCRTYPIRVANPDIEGKTSGPMAFSITYEQLAEWSGIPLADLLKQEKTTITGRQRRSGALIGNSYGQR